MKMQYGKSIDATTLCAVYEHLSLARSALRILVDVYGNDEIESNLFHSNAGTLDDNINALLEAVSEVVDTTIPPPTPIEVALHPTTCRSIEEGDCRSYLDEYGSVFKTQEQMAVVKGALEQLVPSVEVSFNASDDWGVEDKSNA